MSSPIGNLPRSLPARPPAITPRPVEGPTLLSYIQEAVWFLQELDPTSAAYNEGSLIRLEGPVDHGQLERALSALVRRHSALRTSFHQQDGRLLQRVHPPGEVRVTARDLSSLPADQQRPALDAEVRREIQVPFDLGTAPLARFTFWRLGQEQFLLAVVHHIVTDGWSFTPIFNPDLLAFLEAERGAPLPERLSTPPLQYTDFALWEREHLSGAARQRQLDYWKQRLARLPPLQLPLDRPRPLSLTGGGEALHTPPLPRAVTDALRRLAAKENVTLFMLLEAAFKVLLQVYSRQTDLAVGATFAPRARETEQIFGCFTNTLVLRTDLSGNPTFRELLRRVRQGDLEAFSNSAIPFDQVVAEVRPPREPGRLPLFDVLFDLQGRHYLAHSEHFSLRSEQVLPDSPKCDLAFAFVDDAGELSASFIFARDLFDRNTVARMAASLERVLRTVVEDPEVRLEALGQLSQPELPTRQGFNDTAAPVEDGLLQARFEAYARSVPQAPAISFQGRLTSYGRLDGRANVLARWLRERGLGPETPVAVCLERGPDLVAAALGALKAGGAYVPLDPTLPSQRVAYILQDTRAPFLLTTRALQDHLGIDAPFTLYLEEVPQDAVEAALPALSARQRQLAYVIYTSGSTGRPKGVLVEHRSAVNTLAEAVHSSGAGPGSRILQFASAGFDVSIKEMFTALSSGATLVMGAADALLPGPPLTRLVAGEGVTHLILTPQVLGSLDERALGCVRHVITGGEACPPELVDRWAPGRELISEYGPTEGTITSTQVRWSAGAGAPPLGGPTRNARAYVLDDSLRPVPPGVIGELYLAGEGITRGYLGRPELTAQSFLPDPFSPTPGGRLYRSGDRVRLRTDGNLEFHGRVDDQVKLRGHRVELGEIEAALRRFGQAALVVVREDTPGLRQLVGYLVPRPGPEVDVRALREQLAQELPEYMVPTAILVVSSFPLNPSGKVDKAALPAPHRAGGAETADDGPQGPVELAISRIWSELLGVPPPHRNESFFELGGHSLLVPQVVAALQERLGLEVPVRALFEHETLAGLAAFIATLEPPPSSSPSSAARLQPLPFTPTPPGSLQQEALASLLASGEGLETYTVVDAYRVPRALEQARLEQAFARLEARHPVLRSRFRIDGDKVAVEVAEPRAPQVCWRDGSPRAEAELLEEVSRLRLHPGDGQLVRLYAAPGARSTVLVLAASQLVSDAASMDLLLTELLALYSGEALAPAGLQYADYAAWQRAQLSGPGLERELAFWKERLAPPPAPLALPADHPHAAPTHRTGMTGRVNLPPAVAAAFRATCASEAATSFMGLTAAFAGFLRGLTGQDDLVIGAPALGRPASLLGTVGFFINVVAVRLRGGEGLTFRQQIRAARDEVREALAHAQLPMEVLARSLGVVRPPSRAALYETLITMHVNPELRDGGEVIERLRGRTGAAKCALSLRAFDDEGGLGVELEYDADRFEHRTALALRDRLEAVLHTLAAAPDSAAPRR